MKRTILLLNADMSVLSFISFKRAVGLYLQDKVSIVETEENSNFIHPNVPVKYPKRVALKRYIYVPYKNVKICRKNIYLRDKHACQYCSKILKEKEFTIDHVVPKSHEWFPGNIWTNLVTCCFKCNNKKANKTPEEAHMKLIKLPFEPKLSDLVG